MQFQILPRTSQLVGLAFLIIIIVTHFTLLLPEQSLQLSLHDYALM